MTEALRRRLLHHGAHLFVHLDYALLLPLVARLPLPLTRTLSGWRGRLYARLGLDWAELALGFAYIRERIHHVAAELSPGLAPQALSQQRYMTVSREEIDAFHIAQGHYDALVPSPQLLAYLAQLPADRGAVVLTAHFDSFLLTLKGLSFAGRPIYVMTSSIVEDPRVHPAQRRFFSFKYARAERFLNGGRFVHAEQSTRTFLKALRRKAIVVIAGDTPAAPEASGAWVDWFGQTRKMPVGALRLAQASHSTLSAVLTRQDLATAVPVWRTSPVCSAPDEAAYARLFAFMADEIRQHPGLWWASHLLADCEVRTAARSEGPADLRTEVPTEMPTEMRTEDRTDDRTEVQAQA